MRNLILAVLGLVTTYVVWAAGEFITCIYQKGYDQPVAESGIPGGCIRRVILFPVGVFVRP